MFYPISYEQKVDLGNVNKATFRITADGVVIYQGVAHRRPNEKSLVVTINDVCADYVSTTMPSWENIVVESETPTIAVQVLNGDTWEDKKRLQFFNDWTYKFDGTFGKLSKPINGHIRKDMPIVVSVGSPQSKINVYYTRKVNITPIPSVEIANIPSVVANHWIYLPDILPEYAMADLVSVSVGTASYSVVDSCSKYALFYTNALGGWDTFLIEGNYKEVDNLERHTRTLQDEGRRNYANDIRKTFTFHTTWLTDDEASRMHHLLNSTDVYLYNHEMMDVTPVTIKNTSTEYKTFKNNGGKLVNYVIEVEFSKDKIRR